MGAIDILESQNERGLQKKIAWARTRGKKRDRKGKKTSFHFSPCLHGKREVGRDGEDREGGEELEKEGIG